MRGWALAASGLTEGIDQLRQGLTAWQATGSMTYVTYYLGLLADALSQHGRRDEAERVLDQALALVEQTDERLYESELWRLRGEFLIRHAADSPTMPEQAEARFRRAFSLAKAQEARSLQLRAALALRRLQWRFQLPSDAAQLLAEVRATFTKGFETPDLLETDAQCNT